MMCVTPQHGRWTISRKFFSQSNLALFALPISIIFKINFVGDLLISDLLVFGIFLAMLARGKITLKQPFLRTLMILILLWLLSAIASDFLNGSYLRNLMRGWTKIGLFAVYILVFFNLINGHRSRYIAALTGLTVAAPFAVPPEITYGGGEDTLQSMWKFGIGMGLTLLLGLVLMRLGFSRRNSAIGFMVLGPIHMMMGARSMFLTTFLSGFLTFVARPVANARTRVKLVMIGLVLLLLCMSGGEIAYDKMVRSGVFGEKVLEKHLQQTAGGTNIILGGRSESLISLVAIQDSPFFGHGSWAESKEYYLLYLQILQSQGRQANFDVAATATSFLIPSHSYLLGAWMEHGFPGALFWLFTLGLTLRGLITGLMGRRPAQPVEIYLMLLLIWDILFSPFGGPTRCWAALRIALVAYVIQSEKITEESVSRTPMVSVQKPPSRESSKQAS